MNWRRAVPMALTTLALTACGGSDEEVGRTGIYQLEVVRESDTCTPKRAVGHFGQVSVLAETDGYVIPYAVVGEGDPVLGMNSVKVGREIPFEYEGDVDSNNCPGAVERSSLELLSDLDPMEVRYKVRYSNLDHCERDPETHSITLPDSDCEASLRMRYRLVQVCEEPCDMRFSHSSQTFNCDCG